MKRYWLNEDIRPPKLNVVFAEEIKDSISDISWHNRNNIESLAQWHNYLDGLTSYISNPVIAWDNTNRFQHFPNGSTHISEFGYEVTFMVKTNEQTNQSYIYIFKMKLNTEEFALNTPSMFKESRLSTHTAKKVYYLKETQLHQIVYETVRKILISA